MPSEDFPEHVSALVPIGEHPPFVSATLHTRFGPSNEHVADPEAEPSMAEQIASISPALEGYIPSEESDVLTQLRQITVPATWDETSDRAYYIEHVGKFKDDGQLRFRKWYRELYRESFASIYYVFRNIEHPWDSFANLQYDGIGRAEMLDLLITRSRQLPDGARKNEMLEALIASRFSQNEHVRNFGIWRASRSERWFYPIIKCGEFCQWSASLLRNAVPQDPRDFRAIYQYQWPD